jgi:hypothetical protein
VTDEEMKMETINAMKIAGQAPIHTVAVLQQAQRALGDRVFEAESSLERSAIRQAYQMIVRVLEDRLPDANCAETDPWTWETFNDCWKDDNGCRPHGLTWSGRNCRDWLAVRSVNNWLEVLRDHAEDLAG